MHQIDDQFIEVLNRFQTTTRELKKRPKAPATQLPSKGRVTINKYIHKSFFLL
jgi:hypothetical protein